MNRATWKSHHQGNRCHAAIKSQAARFFHLALLGAAVLLASAGARVSADAGGEPQEIAAKLIPFGELTVNTQERLWGVCNKPTLYRRMPVQSMNCNQDMYLFFARNPEVVVNMWQLMGVTNVNLKRTGPFTFDASDGAGTVSKMEIVYGTADTQVMFGEGTYEGPLLKRKVNGRCVMVLKSAYGRDEIQQTNIASQLDVFLQLDNMGVDLIAKTLHPLLGKTADHNFAETANFVGRVSQAIEKNPSGAERLSARLNNVSTEVKDQFIRVSRVAAQEAARRPSIQDEIASASPNGGILPTTRVDRGEQLAPVQTPASSRNKPVLQRR